MQSPASGQTRSSLATGIRKQSMTMRNARSRRVANTLPTSKLLWLEAPPPLDLIDRMMSIHGDRANPYTLWVAAYDLLGEKLA